MIGVVIGIVLVALAHEAGQLGVGRVLGAARYRPVFPSLVEITAPTRGRRALVLGGGFAAAYLALAALAFGYYLHEGVPVGSGIVVYEVLPGFDADSKLVAGDRIATVDGELMDPDDGPTLSERVNRKGGVPIVLGIVRDGAPREVTVTPNHDHDRWLLGIRPMRVVDTRTDIGASVRMAIGYPLAQAAGIAGSTYHMIVGSEPADPGGPVRIVEEFRAAAAPPLLKLALLDGTYVLLLLAVVDLVRLVRRPRR